MSESTLENVLIDPEEHPEIVLDILNDTLDNALTNSALKTTLNESEDSTDGTGNNTEENHNLDNDSFENNLKNEISEEKTTERQPVNPSKKYQIDYLTKKIDDINDKTTIYEYHYEKLNCVYNALGLINILLAALVTLLTGTSLSDMYNEEIEFIIKLVVICLGFFHYFNYKCFKVL